MDENERRIPKALIVGGSIAGISCAHALLEAGWKVQVLEKSTTPPTGSSTGAGLGLDLLSQSLIQSWISDPQLLFQSTLPLTVDQNQATVDRETKERLILSRDENFNFRAALWADLHGLLYNELPSEIFLWGHHFLSFCKSEDKACVKIRARVLQSGEIAEIVGDLLVGADGCLSSVLRTFLPNFELRYSGYCAWRGVLDFSKNENSETIVGLRRAYPELGKCLYFDLGSATHIVLYELPKKKLNWIWYINQPEPQLKGNSMTMRVQEEMVRKMHEQAEKVWVPEFVKVVKETKEPFINVIYDRNSLEQLVWDNVVLVGDAAHPTTPHGLRSTNMSILDAAVLGKCLEKWGPENLQSALAEYQSVRLPVSSKQVLHSRYLGRLKQGLALPDQEPFDPRVATPENCLELQQKNIPFFNDVPQLIDTTRKSI
ncbi:hypothetical protein IC582_006220 [Cucumis melo]